MRRGCRLYLVDDIFQLSVHTINLCPDGRQIAVAGCSILERLLELRILIDDGLDPIFGELIFRT